MAVSMVLLAHTGVPIIGHGGAAGVAIFFTVSEFLITSLLLEERGEYGSFKVLGFYRRRFLRLVPAMVTCVIGGIGVSLITYGYVRDWSLVIGTLTYASNWVMVITQLGAFPSVRDMVEMQ